VAAHPRIETVIPDRVMSSQARPLAAAVGPPTRSSPPAWRVSAARRACPVPAWRRHTWLAWLLCCARNLPDCTRKRCDSSQWLAPATPTRRLTARPPATPWTAAAKTWCTPRAPWPCR